MATPGPQRGRASSRSVSTSVPKRATTAAGACHSSAASSTRLGSSRLCTWSTQRTGSSGPSGRAMRRPGAVSLAVPATVDWSQDSAPVTSVAWGAAKASNPTVAAAAAVRTKESATASRKPAVATLGDVRRGGASSTSTGVACAAGGGRRPAGPRASDRRRRGGPGATCPPRRRRRRGGAGPGSRRRGRGGWPPTTPARKGAPRPRQAGPPAWRRRRRRPPGRPGRCGDHRRAPR